ncbi:unnamed protein product [Heterobilharzia americana]|nr:unnamed protein product [Heterobilharzia americana]
MESTEVNSAAQPDISEVTNSTTTTTTKTNSSNSIIADTVNENEDVVQKDVVNTVKQTIDTNSDVSNPSETTTISYENNELKSISIVREISPQKEYHVASTTEATPSSEAVLTNEDNINYTPKSEATPIDIEISKDMVDETLLKIVETPIEIRKKMAIKVVDEQIQSRGSEMVEEMKTKEISSSTSPSSTKKQIKLSLSLSPDTSSQEVVNTLNELSTTTSTGQSIDGITEPMITETIVKRHNKQQADNPSSESFNSELQTIDTTYVKHPQRPPPPKLNSVKKTQTSLNSSHSSYNDTNEVMTNGISTDSHYKRPSFKSNLKHAFSNLRKSFKRKNKSSHQSYNGSSQQPTHKNNHYIDYNDNHNNGNHQQYNDAHYLSHQDYQSPEEIPESHSNVQSLDPSISDSLQYQREEFDILNPIENIAPPAIPTKMSSDPNQPIYVNHSLQTTNMLDNKNTEAKELVAAVIADSVLANQLSYQETYWASEIHSGPAISQPPLNINYRQSYQTRSEQSTPRQVVRSQSQMTNNSGVKPFMTPDLRYRPVSSPRPSRPNNPPILSPMDQQIQDRMTSEKDIRTRRLDMVNSVKLDNKHSDYDNDHFVGGYTEPQPDQYQPHYSYTMKSSERRIMPYHVPGSLDGRYPQEYDDEYSPETRRIQTMRHSDYPTRLRERIHVYRPVSSSATVSATLPYNGYDRNMTLKPYKPKAIAERYKCSEVYSWPPKFPKLKRRKTQPPKQIHTGQDHVVIKEQIKPPMNYQPPVPNQTHTNEPLHVIKVSQQWNTLNNKRDSDNSPERQVTSLHSVQRSTLLEQSNRTSGPGPGSRNQLFIADYKQMPSSQTSPMLIRYKSQVSSEKPNSLALPYFTKAAENKRFSKFHFTTANNAINDNNINNNIVMSSEVMQSESPKSIGVLKDTVKAMHPFLQEWFEKHKELDNKELKDEERKNDKLVINCLSEYLFTCMKLRSLDLQGEYASFVFPLKSFNEKSWDKYGFIEGWEELSIVCAPNTNHEYVVLNQCDKQSNKLKYTTKTVDKLLTNWLNSQTTKSPLPNGHTSFDNLTANKNKSIEDKALHSIVLTTTLKSILSLFDNKEAGVDIFETCIKLSVLLSLSECLPTSLDRSEVNKTHSEVDLTPENILLILSPSNCLTVFKKFDKIQPTNNHMDKSNDLSNKDDAEKHDAKQALNKENTLKSLFNQLHLHGDSINEVINDILKHLYEITKHEFIFPEMVTSLLKAVAPPDWIAICLARICLYNQTSQ